MGNCIRMFKFDDVDQLFATSFPYTLQPLIASGSPAAMNALEFLGLVSVTKKKIGVVLFNRFEPLLPVMIVKASDEAELEQGLRLVEKLTNKPRSKLIARDSSRIHNELLLFLATKPEKVKYLFLILKNLSSCFHKKMLL